MERELEFFGDDQIDWNQLFDGFPESANVLDSSAEDVSSSSASWIDEIEKVLMKDDDDHKVTLEPAADFYDKFLADILVDSHDAAADPNISADDAAISSKDNIDLPELEDDPISKKRRRQMRNRDAAVRSRERKKMYVKDLEMKSKFLEGECRRLGRLLHCCYAENQSLRFTLQMAKQESAVLFLESLLLGSLLWCLSSLPLKPNLEDDLKVAPPQEPVVAPPHLVLPPFVKTSRRFKSSCPKMKHFSGSWTSLSLSSLLLEL